MCDAIATVCQALGPVSCSVALTVPKGHTAGARQVVLVAIILAQAAPPDQRAALTVAGEILHALRRQVISGDTRGQRLGSMRMMRAADMVIVVIVCLVDNRPDDTA